MSQNVTFNIEKFGRPLDLEYLRDNGRVEQVSDGVLYCSGLSNVQLHEVVVIHGTYRAIVLSLGEELVGLGVLVETTNIHEGMEVTRSHAIASVATGNHVLGRVLSPEDWLSTEGHDGGLSPLFNVVPDIIRLGDVNRPMMTGQPVIDALTPVGRGQRQLILGDRRTGKSQIGIDTILSQAGQDTVCIYVAIGQKVSQVAHLAHVLADQGTRHYTTILSAPASSSLTAQYLAPYAGMALAESWRDQGKDVVVIFDDLTRHAETYRALSMLFNRPPGREAYPGDIFYIHSSLLERAVQMGADAGGGSITALPVVQTLSDDITSYIPTNIISITDGQIFLRTEHVNKGQLPAVDTGLSVSRVGGSAQHPLVRNLSRGLSFTLAQYHELQEFLAFDNAIDAESQKIVSDGTVLLEVLRHPELMPCTLAQLVMLLSLYQDGSFHTLDTDAVYPVKMSLLANASASESFAVFASTLEAKTELTTNDLNYISKLFAQAVEGRSVVKQ
ncbi:F0F1 ATP synthase subunit alpha [Lysinibacter cavernae]|uniref:F-type H+-transporting ATPase subunit alpha n=1 Tax=Lysinibacter cavernae TaxID=1640652 RepID=A0A7X5R1A0_9MICO|nr:F0F1 ATP synthase subunit alpha [Lysinibacter cavernae]NIH53525.1 F-type H+-transporting ATPase subunit alpha [Lysinibacter cavernae]